MLSESRQTAQERSRQTLETRQVEEAETRQRLRDTMHISLPPSANTDRSQQSHDSDDEIGPPLPTQLMKPRTGQLEEDEIGPPLPPGFDGSLASSSTSNQDNVDSADSLDEDEFEDEQVIPVAELIPTACEATIRHGSKPISALCFDAQGSKFATGGYDYKVNLYDFARMDSTLKPYRETSPVECHIINALAFSANGENLLVASGFCQIRILDRKGTQYTETIRGDQYLVDLTNTKGHTSSVNGAMWHPLHKDEFMTCSDDGTLRLWNLSDYKEMTKIIPGQRTVIKTKDALGRRAIPTSCCYSRDGRLLAAGCDDGSIQIWKVGKLYVNTTYMNRKAHSGSITSIQFSYEGHKILSRGMDDTLKLWDLRRFKEPVHVACALENFFAGTDCGFSPGDELVFTGTSVRPGKGSGALVFFEVSTFNPVYRVEFPDVSCIRAKWHPKINQILVGLSDGTVKMYYDPMRSVRGIMQSVSRPLKRERKSEVLREEIILAPLTLQMFQPRGEEGDEQEVTEWRLKKFLRMQSGITRRPNFRKPQEWPMSGPSTGGRVAESGGTLHSYMAQKLGVKRNREFLDDKDVRTSILRHAKEVEENPEYVSKAYRHTQPVPIFQEKSTAPEDEEKDEELQPVFKMPKT